MPGGGTRTNINESGHYQNLKMNNFHLPYQSKQLIQDDKFSAYRSLHRSTPGNQTENNN